MKPPKRDSTDFEKVVIGEFINGEICDIEYEMEHKFVYKGQEKIAPAVRLVFKLDGYEYKHRTRWMTFNYGEKSNLYQKYLVKLVENAKPDMDFDLDGLKGMLVKTIWQEQNDFQSVESIFPLKNKIANVPSDLTSEPEVHDGTSEDVPF